MNKYLSLIFLYNRASYKKILLIVGAIPLCFLAIFLLTIGNPQEASSYMLMERGFGGIWAVLLFVAVNLLGLFSVVNSLNGKKAMKATASTTGYTIRRLRLSPTLSYFTIFVYYLVMTLIFWAVAIVSLYIIGKMGLTMAGATGIDVKFTLGLLRTDIGQALIPIANPILIAFNLVSILALAGECAKSCYLSWHNGRPSFGVVLVIALIALVWSNVLGETYVNIIIVMLVGYTTISFWDVIFRERHPKGDPFKANQYAGVMDLDSFEYDDSSYAPEANRPVENYDPSEIRRLYGRTAENDEVKGLKKFNLARLRRRFMPLGTNLERANTLFGACILLGVGEHLLFLFKYIVNLTEVTSSMKGVTIVSGVNMPYFWDLQEHTYYGYIFAILLVIVLQTYWNYEYYNKKTKSVYVMKRLPDAKEYSRTLWVTPVIQGGFIAMLMVVHTAIDVCVYLLGTPEIAFYPDYLSRILPFYD